jgi:hypothetical protein
MSLGELCISEAQRLIEYAVAEPHFSWVSGGILGGVSMDYWYGRPIPMPAHVKWLITRHGKDEVIGKRVNIHIRRKDIDALRRAIYHRSRP